MNFFDIERLNSFTRKQINDCIMLTEKEKADKIKSFAETIIKNKNRVIFVTGPSASNKTSVAKRLIFELQKQGRRAVLLSLDDYFWGTTGGRKIKKGVFNFENLDALDYELVEKHIKELILGKEVTVPRFDFYTVARSPEGVKVQLSFDDILVVEGIHAFNPAILGNTKEGIAFKIYSSVEHSIKLKETEIISCDDIRLMRRMVRDSKFRNAEADITFAMWPSVQEGMQNNILPFKKDADVVFDSFAPYECMIYKRGILNLLEKCEEKKLYQNEIEALRKKLEPVMEIDSLVIPENSMLREFIGG